MMAEEVMEILSNIDTLWVINAILVFIMQAGFIAWRQVYPDTKIY